MLKSLYKFHVKNGEEGLQDEIAMLKAAICTMALCSDERVTRQFIEALRFNDNESIIEIADTIERNLNFRNSAQAEG